MNKSQSGFTLIEVMIAALVLSIGLLGVFQLHLVAKRSTYESFNYAQAHALATDIVERMRVNPSQLAGYASRAYGQQTFAAPQKLCSGSAVAQSPCNASEMMAWDRHIWERMLTGDDERVDGRIVGGATGRRGCITTAGEDVEVVVVWSGMDETSDGAVGGTAAQCGVGNARRRSVRIVTKIAANA